MRFRTNVWRAIPLATLLAVSVVAAAPVANAGTSRRAAPPAVLVITPNTNLVDNEVVTATAPAGVEDYGECAPGYTDFYSECSYVGSSSGGATDSLHLAARVLGPGADPTVVDCRTTTCTLVAVKENLADPSGNGATILATVALAFDPSGGLRTPPVITATPSSGLVDQQPLAVDVNPANSLGALPVAGYAFPCTHAVASIAEATTDCGLGQLQFLDTESGGHATGTVPADAYVETPTGPVDCRAPAATCTLATFDPIYQVSTTPVGFTADGPVQPELLTRPSATGSTPDNPTLDLVGFTPNDPYTLKWCSDYTGTCDTANVAAGTLDANGQATVTPDTSTPPSCPLCADGCTITATDAHGLRAKGDIDVSTIPTGPTGPVRSKRLPVRATPHKGLHNGQQVAVSGSGFTPGHPVAVLECSLTVNTHSIGACDVSGLVGAASRLAVGSVGIAVADAHGNVSTAITLKQHFTTLDGKRLDCAKGNIDPDAFDAGVAAKPSRAVVMPGYFSCAVSLMDISDFSQSGADPVAFAGEHFKSLPWATPPAAPTPKVAPTAVAATPVAAAPTFTG